MRGVRVRYNRQFSANSLIVADNKLPLAYFYPVYVVRCPAEAKLSPARAGFTPSGTPVQKNV